MKGKTYMTATGWRAIGIITLLILLGQFTEAIHAQSGTPFPSDAIEWFTPPDAFHNVRYISCWNGSALEVDSANPAWINYPAMLNLGRETYTNLPVDRGSLELWFKPNWQSADQGGFGPGVPGRLVDVGAYTTNASYGWWSLYLDAGGTNVYFSAQTNTGVTADYLFAPVSWGSTTWHEIVLTYCATNTAIYLDGQLATNGPGMTVWPGSNVLSNGFYIGSDWTGIEQAHGDFTFIWAFDHVLDADRISQDYAAISPFANPTFLRGGGFFMAGGEFTPDGAGGGGSPDLPLSSTNLWLEILPPGTNSYTNNANSNSVTVVLHNTIADIVYDLFSATNLNSNMVWTLEQPLIGSEATNYTVTTVYMAGRPTLFFKAMAASLDSFDIGIPDWWQLKYFGFVGIDPNGDPMGDGWSNLQKFQNGMNPTVFYAPPTPAGLTVNFNTNGNIVLAWAAAANLPTNGAGAVTGYTINTPDGTFTVGANQTNYVDDGSGILDDWLSFPADYVGSCSVQVNYASSQSLLATADTLNPNYSAEVYAVQGLQGRVTLVAPKLSPNVKAIRVWLNYDGFFPPIYYPAGYYIQPQHALPVSPPSYFDVLVSSFTNGIYVVPDSVLPPYYGYYQFVIRPIGNDGTIGPQPADQEFGGPQVRSAPFVDGRRHLQQNAAFLLQAASISSPFGFIVTDNSGHYSVHSFPGNYVYAGYDLPVNESLDLSRYEFAPFEDNYFYENFVFDVSDLNLNGSLATGAYYLSTPINGNPIRVGVSNSAAYTFDTFGFITNRNWNAPAAALTNWQWTYYPNQLGLSGIGITKNNSVNPHLFILNSGQVNNFGLAYQSAERAYTSNGISFLDTLSAGGSLTDRTNTYFFYSGTAQPQLQTVGYYFPRPFVDPLPGDPAFAVTNATVPLMIAAVGQPFSLTAWAKQSVQNGYTNSFAYIEQYFDKAYTADTNGVATTNATGILSPYGEFFPTQPGPTALVTLPDIDTGLRGTNVIQVISLNVDANHDGTIDTSFTGPDFASAAHPFVFWANSNYDRYVLDSDGTNRYDDDVVVAADWFTNAPTPDCNVRNDAGQRIIPCERDLQDFTRLWISGVTSNLLTNLPPGGTVTLSWGDVGSPDYGNPTIDLFVAAEADGGTGYLTNPAVAQVQDFNGLCPYVGRVRPGQSVQLNTSAFSNNWAGNHFIWCGVSNGSGALTLTIADGGGNPLAQATAYIKIVDIKQMYERWTVGDNPSVVPTNSPVLASDGIVGLPFKYLPSTDTNTPYILFVHGWNMKVWEKNRFAESAFKRLYWQGYQGRFGSFRWPTDNGFLGTLQQILSNPHEKENYDSSERQAWLSGAGLLNKLTDLNNKYPGHVYVLAHSMGNVVTGEALRLAGTNQVVNTYVASQAAVTAHTYDPSIPNYSFVYSPISDAPTTPNIYNNWLAGNSGGVGKRVNFYNTNDYALQRSSWQLDQILKPDIAVLENGYLWDYDYTGATNDPAPWNHFRKSGELGGGTVNFDIVNSLADRYEAMAYAAQPYTTALGATPGITNFVNLNLTTIWPSDTSGNAYRDHFWHSAEFRGDPWQEWNYWNTILFSPSQGFNVNNQ